MGDHSHTYSRNRQDDTGRLAVSILLNLLITIVEVVGGIVSGSLALLSDAIHNLSDTMSLTVSLVARRIGGKEATAAKTFGYRRAEIVGAFINLITLVIIALFLIKESVERFFDPQPVAGGIMLAVALIGLAANAATAALLYRGSKSNLNFRSAFLHILTDGLSSAGVVLGGILIIYFDVYIIDPILTLAISAYLLAHSYGMLRQTVNILMEGTPSETDLDAIMEGVRSIDGVVDFHHLHVWQLDEEHAALEAHVVILRRDLEDMEIIKRKVKTYLHTAHDITHSTLELETAPCRSDGDPNCYDRGPGSESQVEAVTRSAARKP